MQRRVPQLVIIIIIIIIIIDVPYYPNMQQYPMVVCYTILSVHTADDKCPNYLSACVHNNFVDSLSQLWPVIIFFDCRQAQQKVCFNGWSCCANHHLQHACSTAVCTLSTLDIGKSAYINHITSRQASKVHDGNLILQTYVIYIHHINRLHSMPVIPKQI